MLIEIYFTKVTQVNFLNTALTSIISEVAENNGKKCIFSVYRVGFGLFCTNYDFRITDKGISVVWNG